MSDLSGTPTLAPDHIIRFTKSLGASWRTEFLVFSNWTTAREGDFHLGNQKLTEDQNYYWTMCQLQLTGLPFWSCIAHLSDKLPFPPFFLECWACLLLIRNIYHYWYNRWSKVIPGHFQFVMLYHNNTIQLSVPKYFAKIKFFCKAKQELLLRHLMGRREDPGRVETFSCEQLWYCCQAGTVGWL